MERRINLDVGLELKKEKERNARHQLTLLYLIVRTLLSFNLSRARPIKIKERKYYCARED